MAQHCDGCGTKLPGRRGHGWPTKKGGLTCGRSQTQKTVHRGNSPSLVYVDLPCAALIA